MTAPEGHILVSRICGWCGKNLGAKWVMGPDLSPTTGICDACLARMEEDEDD